MEKLNEAKNRLHKTTEEFLEAIDAICKDYESKQEPEFKIGQWVIGKNDYYPTEPERIREIEGCQYKPEEWAKRFQDESYDFPWNSFEYIRPATEEEIESHLKKICEEKGYKTGIKLKSINVGEEGRIYTIADTYDFKYDSVDDCIRIVTPQEEWIEGCSNPSIYQKGKFAEIIPDKKKRPETRDEFRELINHITLRYFDDVLIEKEMDDLLDQYDI